LEAFQQTAAVIIGALPPSDSTQNAVANHEYCSVPITALAKSPTKPSKRFDAKSLEELAAYVHGHISGLLCHWSFCGRGRETARGNSVVPAPQGT
jgi:hypothetical protein